MTTEPDRRAAIGMAVGMAEPGDVVVIAGKGHEQGQETAGVVAAVRRPPGRPRGAGGGGRMIPLTAHEVAAACGVETALDATVTGIAVDSRQVAPGDLFVALPGERTDGLRFVADALAAGASLALVPEGADAAGPAIQVPDTTWRWAGWRRRCGRARARRWSASPVPPARPRPRTSWPRCSTRTHEVVASYANYNTEIGLPLTLARIEPSTQAVVCELGMRGMGQIAYLAELCRPDVAVITAVGPVHLELMGTVERVAAGQGRDPDRAGRGRGAGGAARRAAASAAPGGLQRAG